MPIQYLRRLTDSKRTAVANRHLGLTLAFVAGAVNAGGFLAVAQYTSHMTGVISAMADNLAIQRLDLVTIGLMALAAFVAGAGYSAILMGWGRRHRTHSEFAYPLLWEAALLLAFGILGGRPELHHVWGVPTAVVLLCFVMGLQNAIITRISNAEIRTTHMTGLVTDIGIELGRAVYINFGPESPQCPTVRCNWPKLRLLLGLLAAFFCGGTVGAVGFKQMGYTATVPLAVVLVLLAAVPLLDDARIRARVLSRHLTRQSATPH